MSGTGSDRAPEQAGDDLDAVVAERDELARRVEQLEDRPARRRRLRSVSTVVLLVLTVLVFAVTLPGTWARRTLVDTDRYVATVGPLATDPAVQDYLARTTSNAVFSALDVEQRLQTALADRDPRLAFLAGPISDSVRGFVQDKLRAIFASDAFATYWTQANTFVHTQLIAALRGDSDVLVLSDGRVVLSLLPLVNEGLKAASGVVSELIGRPLELPQITGEEVPLAAVTKIEQVLGIDLPDDFGTVVVYDADELASVQRAVELAARLMTALVILFFVLLVATLWASTRRRRTLIQLATALAVVLVVERRFAIAAADRVVDRAKPENAAAARAVVDRFLGSLLVYTGWLLAIALIALVVALVTGPYPWAVRLRRWVREIGATVGGAVRRADAGTAPAWIAEHASALMLGGAVVVGLMVLLVDLSLGWLVVVALLTVVYELAVQRIRTSVAGPDPAPDAP